MFFKRVSKYLYDRFKSPFGNIIFFIWFCICV
nr:MAG TPA: hypothetical protein [Bacteriophage sp.]